MPHNWLDRAPFPLPHSTLSPLDPPDRTIPCVQLQRLMLGRFAEQSPLTNLADLGTKHLDGGSIRKALEKCHCYVRDGRAGIVLRAEVQDITRQHPEVFTFGDAGQLEIQSETVEGFNPAPHIHEQMTTSNYGYDIAYNFTHNNIMLEHNAMNNKNIVAHMDVHNTQY